jgi:hypothetical protein
MIRYIEDNAGQALTFRQTCGPVMKGELGYLGLANAAQTAKDLERLGHEGDLQPVAGLLVLLKAEVSAVSKVMRGVLDENQEGDRESRSASQPFGHF